jgi:hypothetical protein
MNFKVYQDGDNMTNKKIKKKKETYIDYDEERLIESTLNR